MINNTELNQIQLIPEGIYKKKVSRRDIQKKKLTHICFQKPSIGIWKSTKNYLQIKGNTFVGDPKGIF